MKIIVDRREQLPFSFTRDRYTGVIVEPGTLTTGDYSLHGLTDRVTVERKALDDLVQCLGHDRQRFEAELQRMNALDAACVVIEASWHDLLTKKYKSRLEPHSACMSVLAFSCRYRVPFMFAGNRGGAEYACWGFLRHYLEHARKRLKAIVSAHDDGGLSYEQSIQI